MGLIEIAFKLLKKITNRRGVLVVLFGPPKVLMLATPLPENAHVFKEDQPNIDGLPADVLCYNIFNRLPAKLVGQMRCVSKTWNDLLSQPYFVKSHLEHSIHDNNDQILLVFYGGFTFNNNEPPFTVHPSRSPRLRLTNFIKLPVNTPSKHSYCNVIGSVNGLICFTKHLFRRPVIYIWNPCLSALLPLPPSTPTSHFNTCSLLRFGFDPKTDDYKVVQLTGCLGLVQEQFHTIFSFNTLLQVEVFSMRKGSWETITQNFPLHIKRIYNQNEVCVDGHDGRVHWLGDLDAGRKIQRIVAFDLGTETFNEMSLPDPIQDFNEDRPVVFGFMAGKLCLMSHVEIWVMNEYGVSESWVKHNVFPQNIGISRPFGFISNNEFLFEADDGSLALYNQTASNVKSFKMKPPAKQVMWTRDKVVPYINSLVSVAPRQAWD